MMNLMSPDSADELLSTSENLKISRRKITKGENECEILPGLSIGHPSTNSVERPFLAEHISAKESEYVFQDVHVRSTFDGSFVKCAWQI